MEDKELYNPQTGEKTAPKRPKKFYRDWRFYVYSLIALMLAIVSISSAVTACAAINAGVGQNQDASYSVAQRKNADITTDDGRYNGKLFSVASFDSISDDCCRFRYGSINSASYDYTETYVSSEVSFNWSSMKNEISSIIEEAMPSTGNASNFLFVQGVSVVSATQKRYWIYASFVFDYTYDWGGRAFLLKDKTFFRGVKLDNENAWTSGGSTLYMFNAYESDVIAFNFTEFVSGGESLYFQDVVSYYKELGYQDGYDAGYSEGNSEGYAAGESAGYASGYSEGLEVGNSNGEANGYANGYAAGLNASNYFKSITANNDLVFFDILANITPYYTDGNGNLYYYRIFSAEVGEDFYYCWLCYYSTSNWTQWDVYLVWCDQSSSSGFTLDYLTNHSLGVWGVPKSNGAFSSVQSYAVYNPSIQTLDNAKVSLVYNVQMMQAYVTLDGGRTYGDVYKDGYTTGYQNGYNYGYELGETAGINAAEPEALTTTLVAVFQQPFNQIYRFFNFNILGLNILGLATGLLSVFIIIKVFKKVLK